ncbi:MULTISPECIES: YihY family inner membrane protein [unclassified Roseateles]|jgi:membrane protein|uniref:YihY family inner membrane protein n=1 Tax=unclassified Roseateles TaxID=2626991 RepID=UPI0009E90A60|nr:MULTISPECIES: YihY family inner membrane protein [unclassified Roseateles]
MSTTPAPPVPPAAPEPALDAPLARNPITFASDFITELLAWPWLQTLQTFHQRFREEKLGLTAGSLTFTTLISLVPLLTVMLAIFTAFPIFSSLQAALEQYFLKSLIPPNIAKPVLASLTQFAAKANKLGAVGLVVLGVTALALMLTIDRTLNAIWRVKRPRPMAQRVLVYWAALTLGPLLLGGSLTLTSYAVSVGQGLITKMPGNLAALLGGVDIVLLGLAMAGLFHYVPNTHVRWRHALLGGAFVSLGFALAKSLLAWYVKQVPTFSTLYGAFATVPVFLVWVYLGWVIVLLGAILAANTPSLTGRLHLRPDVPGQPMRMALEVLRELWRVREAGQQGLSHLALASVLRIDPLQLSPVLDKLLAMDWIGRLEEEGAQRLVLLCAPERAAAAPLLAAFLAQREGLLGNLWAQGDWAKLTLDRLLLTEAGSPRS